MELHDGLLEAHHDPLAPVISLNFLKNSLTMMMFSQLVGSSSDSSRIWWEKVSLGGTALHSVQRSEPHHPQHILVGDGGGEVDEVTGFLHCPALTEEFLNSIVWICCGNGARFVSSQFCICPTSGRANRWLSDKSVCCLLACLTPFSELKELRPLGLV